MKRCVILLVLALAAPSMAQEYPKPTPAGEKALDALIERCVAAGGLKGVKDTKTGASSLAPGDMAKLKTTVGEARSALTPPAFDAMITRCSVVKGDPQTALIDLLRVSAQVANDGRAGTFATWFDAQRIRDGDGGMAMTADAARRFQVSGEPAWQAACFNRMGGLMYGKGDLARALEFFQKALEIRLAVLGERHPDVAASYNNIATVYGDQGEHARALEMHLKALEMRRAMLGERHLDVATSYNNIANVYEYQDEHAKALEMHLKALEIRRAVLGERRTEVADSENNIAVVYFAQGDHARALEMYLKALEIRLAVLGERHPDVAASYNNIALVHGEQGEHAKALEMHLKALEIKRAVLGERHPSVATSYNNIANVHDSQGELAKALRMYLKALEIRRAVLGEHHLDVAASYNNIANVYAGQGEHAEALRMYLKALEIRRAMLGERHGEVADSYNNIATVYVYQGEHVMALEMHLKALEIKRAVLGERHPDVAASYNNIATVYVYRREHAKAMEMYLKALEILRAVLGERHPDVAACYSNIAAVHGEQGEHARALEMHLKALEIKRAVLGEHHRDVADSYNNIALVYEYQSEHVKAMEMFLKALEILRAVLGERHPDVADSYNNIASVHEAQGEHAKALEAFDHALSALNLTQAGGAPGQSSRDALAPTLVPLGPQILLGRGHLREVHPGADPVSGLLSAMADYRAAADLLDQLRDASTHDEDKVRRAEDVSELFPRAVGASGRLAAASATTAPLLEALTFAERGAARVFLEGLGRSRASAGGRVTPAMLAEEGRLASAIREIDSRIAREQDKPFEKRDRQAVERLFGERKKAEQDWRGMISRLETDAPQYAALKHPRPCSIAEARACLAEDEVALLYVLGAEASYLMVVSPKDEAITGGVVVHKLPPAGEIAEMVVGLTQPKVLKGADATLERGQAAYRMLLAPAAGAIAGKRLVIVPGGNLGELPFELLAEPAEGRTRFLVQGHAIRYAPSLTALHLIGRWETERPANTHTLWTLGDPVYSPDDERLSVKDKPPASAIQLAAKPAGGDRGTSFDRLQGSGTEVDRLVAVMGRGEKVMGAEANETNVKRLSSDGTLAKYRYIHFACHGVLGTGDNAQPGLVLSQVANPADVDGYLRFDEVTDLRLNADLVVLSACQTGQGKVFRAEGVSGLARAFLYAGSRGVLCSLWQVEDQATSDLMAATYAGLKAGESAADALRSAQLAMIEAGEPPLHWAPFVLIGR